MLFDFCELLMKQKACLQTTRSTPRPVIVNFFLDLLQATNTLKLTANIGLDSGTAGYDLYAEFMDIGLGADASATLQGLSLYMEGDMCLNPGCSVQVNHQRFLLLVSYYLSISNSPIIECAKPLINSYLLLYFCKLFDWQDPNSYQLK